MDPKRLRIIFSINEIYKVGMMHSLLINRLLTYKVMLMPLINVEMLLSLLFYMSR